MLYINTNWLHAHNLMAKAYHYTSRCVQWTVIAIFVMFLFVGFCKEVKKDLYIQIT